MGDIVKVHRKQAFVCIALGCVLGVTGLRIIAPYVPWGDKLIERQQKEICGTAISELIVSNMATNMSLEKRVSALEATLKAHKIEIPGE
tara:strand:- start:1332 stop:1598 length:267 start_codon:yes stop_codon:yes gene_type:complete